MDANPSDHELLKKINSKLGWGVFFLFCITLNTCSVADDVQDALRDRPAAPAADKGA